MEKSQRKNNRRVALGACLIFLSLLHPVGLHAQDASAATLLEKSRAALGPEADWAFRLILRYTDSNARPAASFRYFRSDARRVALLYQTLPADARGFAFLVKEGRVTGYNPGCRCARETDDAAVARRFGLSSSELDPRLIITLPALGEAAAAVLEGRPVHVIGLSAGAPGVTLSVQIDADSFLPLRVERRNEAGEIIRRIDYTAYYEVNGYRIPRRLALVSQGVPALTAEVDQVTRRPVPDFVFTQAYLEEVSPRE